MIQEKKYIDETRQGEAYATREKVGNTKKLFGAYEKSWNSSYCYSSS